MENNQRTWAKALTWQTSGLIIMTGVNYLFLGSLHQSMGLSALLTAMGLITYVIHERLWARVRWGIHASPSQSQQTQEPGPVSPHPAPAPGSSG